MNKITLFISAFFFVILNVSQALATSNCVGQRSVAWDDCFGTYALNDNDYVGGFKDGAFHGFGIATFASGNMYVGEYLDGKRTGQGTYHYADGDDHVGGYKDNKRHGQGTYTFGPDSEWAGDEYVGGYKDNKRIGQGTYTFANGSKWVGEWENDYRNGYGIYYNVDGSVYQEGIFKDDVFLYAQKKSKSDSQLPNCVGQRSAAWQNCFGTYIFSSGSKYVGEFRDDKFHGQGTYTYGDGEKYVGEYKDGNKHGQGTYTWGSDTEWSGDEYVGEWKNDNKHGQGTYTYANGSHWVGAWENGDKNGYGIYYNGDGSVYQEGIFNNGEFQYAQKKSKLDKHKDTCKEIGFTPKTEKFGDCVLKLMDKD